MPQDGSNACLFNISPMTNIIPLFIIQPCTNHVIYSMLFFGSASHLLAFFLINVNNNYYNPGYIKTQIYKL